VSFRDENGLPLDAQWLARAKRQRGDLIRSHLESAAADITAHTEGIGRLHEFTPRPNQRPQYQLQTFPDTAPQRPVLKRVTWFTRLLGRRVRVDADNAARGEEYATIHSAWDLARRRFDVAEAEKVETFAHRLNDDVAFMHDVLEAHLHDIVWPRETQVAFAITSGGASVGLDVDLPTIGEIPRRLAHLPARGYALTVKDLKGRELLELYSRHVHSVSFRVVGEVFAVVPHAERVTLSAFTTRPSATTGQAEEAYILSMRATRSEWVATNFDQLAALDVVRCFERFALRRTLAKNGEFLPIEPFAVGDDDVGP
jgi:hypothetical protein